nr:gliding motility-associated C-terminal domain-containing protein [Saprospiraceae bacterium]
LCEGTFNVTVTDNPPLQLALDTVDISCFGADDGMALADPSGGVGNFSYQWSNTQSTQAASPLPPGQYDVTVTDGNGCTITGGVFVTEPPDVGINLLGVVDLLCNGIPTGEIDVVGVGGRPAYSYSADGINFVSSSPLTGLPAGDYWIKVKDSAGCIDSVMATIAQPPQLIVAAEPADTTLELGFTIDISTITAPAGRPVVFEWTPPLGISDVTVAEPTITAVSNQVYVIKITDQDGCVAFDTVNLRVSKNRPVYFPNVFAPDKPYPDDHFTGFSGPAVEQFSLLRIYDRWGELVFEKENFPLNEPNFGWDGTFRGKKMTGVFTWYALVRFVDQVELPYDGNVTVVR